MTDHTDNAGGQMDLTGVPSASIDGTGLQVPAKVRKPRGPRGPYKTTRLPKPVKTAHARRAMFELQISNCNELFDAQLRKPTAINAQRKKPTSGSDIIIDLNPAPAYSVEKAAGTRMSIYDDKHPDHLQLRYVEKFYDDIYYEADGKKVIHKKTIKLSFKVPILMGTDLLPEISTALN